MSKRKAGEMEATGGAEDIDMGAAALDPRRSARQRLSDAPMDAAAAVRQDAPRGASAIPAATTTARGHSEDKEPQPAAAASSSGVASADLRSLHRLAKVELQLVMQHCDLQTLLALARCSHFTLAAASHDFAWRSLSPLSVVSTRLIAAAAVLSHSLALRFCDVSLCWVEPPDLGFAEPQPVAEAELAAIESVTRLVALDTRRQKLLHSTQMQRLLSHPSLSGLLTLHTGREHLDAACVALLPVHQSGLRTLTLKPEFTCDFSEDEDEDEEEDEDDDEPDREDPRNLLEPLTRLRSLTDLSLRAVDINAGCAASLAACTSLRRLHISMIPLHMLANVLAAPSFPQLESLSLDDVRDAEYSPEHNQLVAQMWTAVFTSQRALRSLSLRSGMSLTAALEGAAAALRTGNALRNLTALHANSLRLPVHSDDRSLLPLLSAHCPQLRRLHLGVCSRWDLAALPLLIGLRDLRLTRSNAIDDADWKVVGQCAALRTLHLTDMEADQLRAVLCSEQLRGLETLTLEFAQMGEDAGDDDWSLCFSNLHALHTLNVDQSPGVNRMLGVVHSAAPPALRRIRFFHSVAVSDTVADPTLLATLLGRLPSLRVELLDPLLPPEARENSDPDLSAQRAALYAKWRELDQRYPARAVITEGALVGELGPFDTWNH